ncbi:FAD-dependent oxidoreductase [Stutzerimonas stutzeri]|uniref:FAD-dependent oxidoreductase n=1 Tax=Stutzerimonas stutzeri TaxID=316 RepID=UPI00210A7055|nr:bifunctional TVP38/TMEM64 family protein/FAD-dependent oxidoreductase [Stutzerimonas stutzeri]MCQ4259880.1 FAD-dependent oxidoreductase [Stutzerimonas stutzeri]
MKLTRILIILAFVVAGVCFFWFDLGEYLTLENIQSRSGALRDQVQAHPWWAGIIFFTAYVALTVLSFPGTVILTLLAGALFGLMGGTLLVSFASNVGALIAMLISRFLLRDWVQRRFAKQIASINRGLERDGSFYLFSLRLIPLVPFVLLNPALGLTRVSVWTFWWTTQAGMLPGNAIYVNAGRQLAKLQSVSDILSPSMIGTLILLAVFPLAATRLLTHFKARKAFRGWQKPKYFEHNLVVIGAGSGGLTAARIAASKKARVALIEHGRLGGAALHSGSVPARVLMKAANTAHSLRQSEALGGDNKEVDFTQVMQQVRHTLGEAQDRVTADAYRTMGVEVMAGEARLTSPWTVQVGDREISSRSIILATGSKPFIPDIPGLDRAEPLTPQSLWQLEDRPDRLLVLGGDRNACELAQAMQRLGCQVTILSKDQDLLEGLEPEARQAVCDAMRADGVQILLDHAPQKVDRTDEAFQLVCQTADQQNMSISFDRVLVAMGRQVQADNLGLEDLQLKTREDGSVEVDEYLATRYPNIFAVGAVSGPDASIHEAAHHAWFAAMNALFSGLRRIVVSDRVVPVAAFTSPEVAMVGVTEAQAKAAKTEYEVTLLDLEELSLAHLSAGNRGFVKVITERGRDRILGVTFVGDGASEALGVFVLAMKHKLGLNKLHRVVHLNPSMAEASIAVADAWRQAHSAKRPLIWAERLQRWRRGREPEQPHADDEAAVKSAAKSV